MLLGMKINRARIRTNFHEFAAGSA